MRITSDPSSRLPLALDAGAGAGRIRPLLARMQRFHMRGGAIRLRAVPRYLRVGMISGGMTKSELRRLVRTMGSFDAWSTTLEAFGESCLSRGELKRAGYAFHYAQVVFRADDERARQLRRRAAECYLQREDMTSAVLQQVIHGNARIDALVERPADDSPRRDRLVVIVAGFGIPKERFHKHAKAALRAGYTVVRIDLPDAYPGDDHSFLDCVCAVLDTTIPQLGINPDHVHLMGSCLGGSMALETASHWPVASVTAVSSMADGLSTLGRYPTEALRPQGPMPDVPTEADLRRVASLYDVRQTMPLVGGSVRLVYGACDTMVSAHHMRELAAATRSHMEEKLYLFEGHCCPGKTSEIVTDWIDFIERVDAGKTAAPPLLSDAGSAIADAA